jgi:indole-3-glycerol phosphate synthase/phosphoribosylanthranilate isomerase
MAAVALGLDVIQLHGNEDASYVRMLKSLLAGRAEIWAAQAVGDEPPALREGADRTLFDTLVGTRTGGTGQSFDWRLADGLLAQGILAGGLNPANIRAAARTGAWALDVGSGVEAWPGLKDRKKLDSLFAGLRPDCRGEARPCS